MQACPLRIFNARSEAEDVLKQARGADARVALKVLEAATKVIVELNSEIDKRSVRVEAILDAAKSVSKLALNFAASQNAVVEAKCVDATTAAQDREASSLESLSLSLKHALEEIQDLDSQCTSKPTPITDLALSRDSLTISKDTADSVVISGGRSPYLTPTWKGSDPGGLVVVQMLPPGNITVFGTSKIGKTDTTYDLEVRDSSIVTKSKVLKIRILQP